MKANNKVPSTRMFKGKKLPKGVTKTNTGKLMVRKYSNGQEIYLGTCSSIRTAYRMLAN
jgi:hypothetical protein